MGKKWKQRQKKDEDGHDVNKAKRYKKNRIEKKVKKEKSKKEEEKKEKEEDKKEKLKEKIYNLKYLSVYVGNEDCDDGVETYRENGEKVGLDEEDPPLHYSDFGFKVDVDTGRILDWPDTKLSVKVNMRVQDTGFYDFYDKDNNKIYETSGYVPHFFDISSKGYGDNMCFDTDVNGFILDWKEKKVKKKIIEYLKEFLLDDDKFVFN